MPLRSSPLWITSVRAASDGKACRDLTVYDPTGTPLMVARAFNWGRDIVVRELGDAGAPILVLRRRRSFPLTGKVDVLDASSGQRVGLLHRNGAAWDARGTFVGRFADARSMRRMAAESLVEGVGTAIVGGDAGAGSSPSAYTYTLGNRVIGGLIRAPLPFATEPASSPPAIVATVARILPRRMREAVEARPTRGWRLDRGALPSDEDPRLSVAAALLRVELSQW
jgi:hypothetical protein